MRSISTTISTIIATLPTGADFQALPETVQDNLTVMQSELRIISRANSYTAPEGKDDTALWDRLSTTLYRYMPPPAAYSWAAAISVIITG